VRTGGRPDDPPGHSQAYRVPPEAIRFLLLQRSRYRCQPLYRLFSLLGAGRFYKDRMVDSRFERSRALKIGRQYRADVEETLSLVEDRLPGNPGTIVDIGCGIGGMSLGLWQRFSESIQRLYLLDRSELSADVYTGFRDEAAFYNSLEVASQFLTANDVPDEVIQTVDVAREPYPDEAADIVISTFAWGFHFPVSTYLDEVRGWLAPGGVVLLDVRDGTGGEEELRRSFSSVERIRDGRSSGLFVAAGPLP
jgi:SAM-dependent methyltransferase